MFSNSLLRSGIELLHICQPTAVLQALFDLDFEAWYVDSLGPPGVRLRRPSRAW